MRFIALFPYVAPLLLVLCSTVLGQDNTTGSMAPITNETCAGDICEPEVEYCYEDLSDGKNITQCIPTNYPCGSRECPNNPTSFCDITSGTCKLASRICEGVITVEQNCADPTVWKRWTLAGDLSSVSTAVICEIEDECDPPSGENSSEANTCGYYYGFAVIAVVALVSVLGF